MRTFIISKIIIYLITLLLKYKLKANLLKNSSSKNLGPKT